MSLNGWNRLRPKRFGGGCAEATKKLGISAKCCPSCHDEADDEVADSFSEVEIGDEWFDVCCGVKTAATEALKDPALRMSIAIGDLQRKLWESCGIPKKYL